MVIQIRIRLLPRVRSFSNYGNTTVISEGYGESFFDLDGNSSKKCIGKDLYGRYICLDTNSISIYESTTDSIPLYTYSGLSDPTFAKQISNGSYIVANTGSIIELDETLSSVTKTYNIPGKFSSIDYSEQNKTLLIVRNFPLYSTYMYEITWQDNVYGDIIWNSFPLPPPFTSRIIHASYNRNNFDEIVATDGIYVYIVSKKEKAIERISQYGFSNSVGEEGSKKFNNPYRVYFHDDNTICVVEKDGEILDFDTMYSSSSSIDSSSSSTSSSSSSSSSTSSSSSSLDNRGIGIMIIETDFIVG